jgi:hypothetical protein
MKLKLKRVKRKKSILFMITNKKLIDLKITLMIINKALIYHNKR